MWPRADFTAPGAMAMQAPRLVDVEPPRALAGRAVLLPRHGDHALAAGDRVVELDCDRLMQIDAALGRPVAALRFTLVKTSANRSPKVGASVPWTLIVKSNPSKP